LTIEQVESTSFIALTYEDTDPVRAQRIVNTLGEVSSELISERSAAGSQLTAKVYEKAIVPDSPVSPDPNEAERSKEKELLQALGRCGKLTAVEAALETSLSVEVTDRMLSELAARGHLEVTVEHGRLYYALWGDRGEDRAWRCCCWGRSGSSPSRCCWSWGRTQRAYRRKCWTAIGDARA
jgi:hypothetical protein